MTKKIKFELSSTGARKLMQSPQVQALLRERAEQIRARAGDGFTVTSRISGDRAQAVVSASTRAARERQARDHVIERALGASG